MKFKSTLGKIATEVFSATTLTQGKEHNTIKC